mmetsp:Transcript_12732/g.23859  ORF Transcript_12732/g.23859 Transcript_12732/m.23859 type:complete len:100 (-) Transcript_12732:153-452(-)
MKVRRAISCAIPCVGVDIMFAEIGPFINLFSESLAPRQMEIRTPTERIMAICGENTNKPGTMCVHMKLKDMMPKHEQVAPAVKVLILSFSFIKSKCTYR